MSNGYDHHFGPRPQTDAQAANSAEPDTDRKPLWNDPGYEAYMAYLEGLEEDAEEEEDPGWGDDDEDWDEDEEDDEDDDAPDLGWEEDQNDMQRIKDEWDAYDRDPPGS